MLAACAKKKQAPEPTPPPAPTPAARPLPPGGAPPTFKLPKSDGKGGWDTPNNGIADPEAIWHLRSALNVAALACDRTGSKGIVAGYNKLLTAQKAAFAKGYAAEGTRHGKGTPLDRHVTSVYNYFAQPPAQAGFCPVAADVLKEAATVSTADFPVYAPKALARLEAPFTAFYTAFAAYEVELAAWEKGGGSKMAAAEPMRMMRAAPAGPPWRIQLGAYSGDKAAREAWGRISKRMSKAADFEPRYEPVPGKTLVRVQIGPVTDRDEAIALCAAASAAALDCFPVAPKP
ncbi:SPOR domain-containing protein [Sphingomonas montanisoli]|uniref:SPOR domain-containing protein n=1 Tax=Sphingomonas montanisoli TaxID=2606412 RepID=A0A5D9C4G1_9SPHN|nr:SPOR domain-containing protein [Sphingomonas montanisoli]TZG26569.1 SPOR domain-containing protein [Sphingomonas montanisoli]